MILSPPRRMSALGLVAALVSGFVGAGSPAGGESARSFAAPPELVTGWSSSRFEAPVEVAPTLRESVSEYRIALTLDDEADRWRALDLGLAPAAVGPASYQVSRELLQRLLVAFPALELRGGVTSHRFAYGPGAPDASAAAVENAEETVRAPGVVQGVGSFLISSGTVNDPIPDQGAAWRWVQVTGGAPPGSVTTSLQYRLRIHNDAAPNNLYCGDFEVSLSSDARGGAIPFLRVYDNLGGRTDGGFDDDPEDDADIYLNWRTTGTFNGENPNQRWYVYVADTVAADIGLLQYIEFQVFWDAPNLDFTALDVYFRTQAGGAGTRVDTPVAGQQLYPHFDYLVSAPSNPTGTIWRINLDGAPLCTFTGTEAVGSRTGWCIAPWTVTAGAHNLHGRLDPNGSFAESNEGNNDANRNFTAGGGPEIRISPLGLTQTEPTPRPIYLEIDWMADGTHSHQPSQAVLDRVRDTFAAAGYALHIELSDAVPHQNVLAVVNTPSDSPAIQTLMATYFDRAADPRYYYSLWGHDYSWNGGPTGSSGIADLPGRVHLVTLGSFPGNGTFSHRVGTLIHEFGHNLGQRHGGADHENWKPNYLSVMNYRYQLEGLGVSLLALGFANTSTGFDDFSYSHGLSPALDENALDERRGIGLGRAVDWDCDGVTEPSVARDIQAQNRCSATSSRSILADHDNWSDIAANIRLLASGEKLRSGVTEPCLSWQEHEPLYERVEALRQLGILPAEPAALRVPGAEAGKFFTIFNDGTGNLNISSLALDVATPWLTWEPQAPFTVLPGGSQRVHVYVDFSLAPAGQTQRRLIVGSNDADENPYPGAVNLTISGLTSCTLATTSSPVASGTTTGDVTAPCGTAVVAKAFPNAGSAFVRWTRNGTQVSTSAEYGFTLSTTTSLVAEFSGASGDVQLVPGVVLNHSITGTTQQGSWRYYFLDVPAGSSPLVAELFNLPSSAPQDLDLYLRFGQKPTLATWDCRPFAGGGSSEQCSVAVPLAGRYWIGVNNFDLGTMTYSVRAQLGALIFADGFESGNLSSWSSVSPP